MTTITEIFTFLDEKTLRVLIHRAIVGGLPEHIAAEIGTRIREIKSTHKATGRTERMCRLAKPGDVIIVRDGFFFERLRDKPYSVHPEVRIIPLSLLDDIIGMGYTGHGPDGPRIFVDHAIWESDNRTDLTQLQFMMSLVFHNDLSRATRAAMKAEAAKENKR